MSAIIPIFVGFDEREAVGYHVFCESVLARTQARVAFHPVRGASVVGSTQFNPGRFGVARAMGYRGWAIWAECDMLCRADIAELLDYAVPSFDVLVVKHDYRTRHPVKFLGQPNPDYACKNWSSLMLVNCANAAWQRLEHGTGYPGQVALPWTLPQMHRFEFVEPGRVGELPPDWNHLVGEYAPNPEAKIAHFTVGLPIWPEYRHCEFAGEWFRAREAMLAYQGHMPQKTAEAA